MRWYWLVGLAVLVLVIVLSRRGERVDSPPRRSTRSLPSAGEVDELLRAGRKIEAIKAYRALHGVDLKEAKDAVDARARELGR